MAFEQCPQCGHTFEGRKHRYTEGLASWFKVRTPDAELDGYFMVRCPNCRVAYPSESLRVLGVKRKHLLFAWFLVILAIVAVSTI